MIKCRENKFNPDWAPPPGMTISEVLDGLSMTQVDLARRLGLTTKFVSHLISGKASLSEETALLLERVLGVRAGFWLGLEKNYQLYLAREQEKSFFAQLSEWAKLFPIKDMVAYKYFSAPGSVEETIRSLLSFFGVANPQAWQEQWSTERQVSFRSSKSYQANPYSVAAWLRHGQRIAQQEKLDEYDGRKFKASIESLRALTVVEGGSFIAEMKEICRSCGVLLLFIPELKGTTLSGAAYWVGKSPVIQLSLRHKTDDHLWFSFFHEMKHILDHSSKSIYIGDRQNDSEEEIEANIFSRETLIPLRAYQKFVAEKSFSLSSIKSFGKEIGIAPGIIVGRLQHDGHCRMSFGNDLKKRYTWKD